MLLVLQCNVSGIICNIIVCAHAHKELPLCSKLIFNSKFNNMKKIFSLFALACCSMLLPAQVYYLLPNSAEWNSEAVTNVYDNPSHQNQLQWETSEGDVQQVPERKAYEWFKDTYNSGAQKVVTYKDLTDGRLAANGNMFNDVKVIWIYVDRWMTKDDLDALFPAEVRTALANYVKAGGNLYLSTYAARLAYLMGRAPEPGFSEHNGFAGCSIDDPWRLKARAYRDGDGGYNIDNHGHAIYKYLNEDNQYVDDYRFNMQSGTLRTDRNRVFDMEFDNPDSQNAFESNNTAKVLAGWGHEHFINCAGLVEFYPVGDWKGTIITNGLAACSWAACNESVNCVKLLTKGILDYLSIAEVGLAWNDETVPASGVINTTHIMTAHANAGFTIRYGADDPVIANIGDGDGNIYFNYFGNATFTATATGDGWTAPKNATATIHSATISVNGGNQNVKYAYVLPYSMHVMANYDNEEGLRPDFEAANWFYWQYVVNNIGCFVRPSDLGSLNSAIKVLWIHNDHVGKDSQEYYNDLGGDTFRDNLAAFVNAGGNVFVSKQATRLIGDLGRNEYPQYQNGGYDNRGPWRIGNKWNLGGIEVDHSTHSVYANMGTNTEIMESGRHTDNNCVWFNFDTNYGDSDIQRLYHYQDDHNCRILGAWGHDAVDGVNSLLQNAGMVEYYPQTSGQGTIIAMGLAAFHWANPTELLKNFTRDILYYLNIDEAPGFVWIQEPQDGSVGTDQIAQVEHKDSELNWTSSNTDVVEIVDDPDHSGDKNYKKLLLKAEGTATVTATRSGDGYKIPKNVTSTTSVTKTITVTNSYTRGGLTPDSYYTICLPKGAVSYSGAQMFRLADKTTGDGIVIEEVNDMEAGVPYIFLATGTELTVIYDNNATAEAQTVNGLIGYIGSSAMQLSANTNYYILAENQIWQVDQTVTIPSNRAYIDMSAISSTPAAAGRMRYVINIRNTPTALDNLSEENVPTTNKILRGGQLLIQQGEHLYNAQGQIVK